MVAKVSLMGKEVHRMLTDDKPIAHVILLRKESCPCHFA
jgi:hypothetical protein